MNQVLTSNKRGALRCGRELGRGGEGAVFELADRADCVAKIYHSPPDPQKANKLVAMASGCTERLASIAAWPLETIHEPSGRVVGFVMRKVTRHKDIHVLYGPKTRLREYPDANYRFLIHVATNVARSFAVVHEHGHVIGDVNQGGVCVSDQGTVTLVDCDSFQIRGGGAVFGCDVGIPIYQPPEFQSVQSFHGLARTPNHDSFGLGVLIFQTLFLARHPYAGAFQGDGDMPIERAIREFRFAYGRDASRRQMRQPPGSLGLGSVPPVIAELFERAFLESGALGGRPTALEWVNALDAYLGDLKPCSQNSSHVFLQDLATCPLCELELRVGVVLFLPAQSDLTHAPVVDLEMLWREVLSTLAAAEIPTRNSVQIPVVPPPAAVVTFQKAKSRAATIRWLGIVGCVLLSILWHPVALLGIAAFVVLAYRIRGAVPDDAKEIEPRFQAARQSVETIVGHLERERAQSPLPELKSRMDAVRARLQEFPQQRAKRLAEFERARREQQMRRYLDLHEVKDARLPKFGPGLYASLLSHGVQTADDVTTGNLTGIPGFGPKRVQALLGWRRSLEGRFTFNPSDPADVRDRARLERELQNEYAKHATLLSQLAESLKAHAAPLRQRVGAYVTQLDEASRSLATVHSIRAALAGVGKSSALTLFSVLVVLGVGGWKYSETHFDPKDVTASAYAQFDAEHPNDRAAIPLFKKACDVGEQAACMGLGLAYLAGRGGLPQDASKARALLEAPCSASLRRGCTALGKICFHGLDGHEDRAAGQHFWQNACEGGDAEGCYLLGTLYTTPEGSPEWHDFKSGYLLLKTACDGGYSAACEDATKVLHSDEYTLPPEDLGFVDQHGGRDWGDRCLNHVKLGQLDWAKAECDRAMAMSPASPQPLASLLLDQGLIAQKRGEKEDARSYFKKSLALQWTLQARSALDSLNQASQPQADKSRVASKTAGTPSSCDAQCRQNGVGTPGYENCMVQCGLQGK
jgi:DNA-binding helix-hairpin-helix protein with protein kinase domain